MYKLKIYEEAIIDPIHSRQQKEVIKEEIQNLENYQTWEYNHDPTNKKAVGLKWVFKVKYAFNRSIAYYKARLIA